MLVCMQFDAFQPIRHGQHQLVPERRAVRGIAIGRLTSVARAERNPINECITSWAHYAGYC